MGVWRRRGAAASARLSVALYSVYSGLYSEAVVSSVASAVALVEVGRFREAVEYVRKAAKALYEAAKDVFEHVRITVQRLVELFVEAVVRMLAWVDEHKAYLFLMAAVAAGVVALSVALNIWGLIELDKLAYAASLTPFIPAGVREHPREEAFKMLREAPDPYEKFKKIARDANAGRVKLAEPWESLRVLIMPRPSEERRLIHSKTYRELDEGKKRALFYAALALEEAFDVYRKDVEAREKVVQRVVVGEEPFKKVVYVADLKQIKQLTEEEETAFEEALRTLRRNLNEYAHRYGVGDLNVEEGKARGLVETEQAELSKFTDVNFGTKAYAALIAYREYALGRRSAFGIAAGYWLEVGGSAWLLYYAPITAYDKAERAGVERPVAVEEVVAEALRRLFLKPGANHYHSFVEELVKGGELTLMLEGENESSYVFRLYRLEEGGKLVELEGVKLSIREVGEGKGIVYILDIDVERGQKFFGQELEAGMKAAEEVKERLPVEDRLLYMLGWVNSDVAISGGLLQMSTSHLWQLAETHALFDWSDITVLRVGLTLEGPKLQFHAYTSLEKLDEAIRRSAEGGWLHMLGTNAGLEDLMHVKSWEGLKQWVADHWGIVVDATVKRLGEEVRSELEALRDRLNDDKIAREVVAPALLLIQAERLGVNEATLRYFAAVASGAIGGDGYVSAAMKKVVLASGKREIALLWKAAFAAHGIEAKVLGVGSEHRVIVSGGNAARLAGLYFLYGSPLLEGDERIINHKLAEAVKLAAERLSVSWEGLRRRTEDGPVAADVTISVSGAAVKYNVYLRENTIILEFASSNRSRAELAARLLKLAGVSAEVKKEGSRDTWYVRVATDRLAAGREELRKAIAEVVKVARKNHWIDASKAEGWLERLEKGRVLMEGWPKYEVRLARSGALEVKFGSTNLNSIQREAQRLENMGLVKGTHFTVKMPEEGREGYVYIRREGLAHAAFLSVYGKDEQQRRLAADFVEYILQRAEEEGDAVCEKVKEIVKEGKERGSLRLEGFKKEVEVDGKKYVVNIISGGAEFDEGRSGKKLLRIRITAEVDGVRREYAITFGRYGNNNAAKGFAYVSEETDAERLAAVVEALTGVKPKIRRRSDGIIELVCGRSHLEGFRRFAELADAVARWLEETSR
jgi:tetratricopeptide (TPR) repeat protein